MKPETHLKRTLSLPQMVFYGLGTTIGAGIYALVGELAGIAGLLAPAAFLFASFLAGMTALSFIELSCRYPLAAGTAVYAQHGFDSKSLGSIIGFLVILAGLVSAAALLTAFSGYLNELINLDKNLIVILIGLSLTAVAVYGINESVWLAAVITLIEVGGLIWIIFVSQDAFHNLPDLAPYLIPDWNLNHLGIIISGALLAFYAFIGFEDMVVVAEEVKDVKRNLPLAIFLTLLITTVIYLLITLSAVLSMPLESLASSDAPLTELHRFHTGSDSTLITAVAALAIINGALIQLIMASRVIYGLSHRGQLPSFLSILNARTQTPINATLIVGLSIITFALIGQLSELANLTSLIMLIVFSIVNLSLWRIKKTIPIARECINLPRVIPLIAFFISAALVIIELGNRLT